MMPIGRPAHRTESTASDSGHGVRMAQISSKQTHPGLLVSQVAHLPRPVRRGTIIPSVQVRQIYKTQAARTSRNSSVR